MAKIAKRTAAIRSTVDRDQAYSVADAVALPNVVARGHPVRVESARAPEGFVDALRDLELKHLCARSRR